MGTLSVSGLAPGESPALTVVSIFGFAGHDGLYISTEQKLVLTYGVDHDFEQGPLSVPFRLGVTTSSGSFEKDFTLDIADDRQEDADRDGLKEEREEDELHTSDVLYDSDGDGIGDGHEVSAGTSPTDPGVWPPTSFVGWGNSSEGERAAPAGGGVIALATGQYHSLALQTSQSVGDPGVWVTSLSAWGGYNSHGQTDVPGGAENVVAVAAGGDFWQQDSAHSVALRRDGTVTGWGYGEDGQIVVPPDLGPVIPPNLGPVMAIAAGRTHCLALKNDGTVVAWGYNPHGSIEPPPNLSGVVAISAGGFQSLALKSNGTVVMWGSNFDGNNWHDAKAPAGLCDVVAISAGRFHSLALKGDGTVAAWGYNLNGQTDLPAVLTDLTDEITVTAVSAGGFHSLALLSNGRVVAWGLNNKGQTTVPVSAQDGVKLISAGILHSLAVRQSDYPEITSSPRILSEPGVAVNHQVLVPNANDLKPSYSATGLPVDWSINPVTGLISGSSAVPLRQSVRIQVETNKGPLVQSAWIVISQGLAPTDIALASAGAVENSAAGTVVGVLTATDPDEGDSHTFELIDGPGSTDNSWFRIETNPFGEKRLIVDRAFTRDHEANQDDFSIRVRARDASLNPFEKIITLDFIDDLKEDADRDGLQEDEELVQNTSDTLYDTDGDGFGDGFEVHAGTLPGSSASTPTGRLLVAWGANGSGQATVPTVPLGLVDVIELACGNLHNLALKSNGRVIAWGANGDHQTDVPADLTGVIAVDAGDSHSLALKNDGTVVAWGKNTNGQATVPEELSGVIAIAAGGFHNLALKSGGTVTAWGYNTYSQSTVPEGLADVVAVAAGGFHSMALKGDGTVVAWGSDWDGVSTVPEGLSGVIAIAAGGYHCMALKYDGTVVAWGSGQNGQTLIPPGLSGVTAISAGWLFSTALKADGTPVAWGDNAAGQTNLPLEAKHIQKLEAGDSHCLALRQDAGFPSFADVSPVRSWPGESVTRSMAVQPATATQYSAMGLPAGLAMDPGSGLIEGPVTIGDRRAVRITAVTGQGTLSRVIWINTADGTAPTDIGLSHNVLAENSAEGTVVGILTATDPNFGDSHTFGLSFVPAAPDSFRFHVSGNELTVRYPLGADYDAGQSQLTIRVVATDSGGNTFEKDFPLQLTDDRMEDADGDGINEMNEEDVLGSSDSSFDNFNTSDADHDGVAGLIEYAFNLDPKIANHPVRLVAGAESVAGLPAVDLVPDGQGGRRLRMEYLRRTGAGLTYTPQFAANMDWAEATGPVTVTPIGDGTEWERCVVEDSQSTPSASKRFGRVRVSW